MDDSDTDLLLDDVHGETGHRFFFHRPSLAADSLDDSWWSATQVVRLPVDDMLRIGLPGQSLSATIVQDLDPIESGLDESHGRYEADWCSRKPEPVNITGWDDLGPVVTAERWAEFRLRRDRHRIANGLPRHVIRSDVYDVATQDRAPLHALRHPWPPGIFFQGGKATRYLDITTPELEATLPDDALVVERKDGTRVAAIRDQVFIEAFPPSSPDNPSGGFMRGQGATFNAAEDALWAKWCGQQDCASVAATGAHRWETRGYRNGAGFCGECGVFGSGVFDLAEIGSICDICKTATYWMTVKKPDGSGEWLLCKEHAAPSYDDMSDEKRAYTDEGFAALRARQIAHVERLLAEPEA